MRFHEKAFTLGTGASELLIWFMKGVLRPLCL